MTRVIRCDCGFEAVSDSDDELVALAGTHAGDAHGMEVPRELLLTLARPVSEPEPPRRAAAQS